MKRYLALAAALLAAPLAAQTLTLTNLKGPIAKACNTTPPKSIAEIFTKLAACNQAAPAPSPTPTPAPTGLDGVLDEGDSISQFWGGNHTGIYAKAHPTVRFYGNAVGGSRLKDLIARQPDDLVLKPKVVTVLIGANEIYEIGLDWAIQQGGYATADSYVTAVLAYTDKFRAAGSKVYLSTILPQCGIPQAAAVNKFRVPINLAIRKAATAGRVDGVIDYAADPVMGPDAAACDKALYQDGLHPTDGDQPSGVLGGQDRLAVIYGAAVGGTTASTPAPVPTPTPTPTSAVELAPIASGIDVTNYLVKSWGTGAIPESSAADKVGAFRFLCAPGQLSYDDPILYPGQPGKSHLHQWFGNTLADANSTYASLRTTGESTCNNLLNRSAYWVPAMMASATKVAQPDYLSVYYKRMPASDPQCKLQATACVNLPRGLRYVFGYSMTNPASTPTNVQKRWWNCDTTALGQAAFDKNPGGHYASIREAMTALGGCPVGARLGMVVVAPNCWDGKNLDSADHRSHMAYQFYDGSGPNPVCPKTHPYIVPEFQLGEWWTVDATTATWYLSSDRMAGMPDAEPGTTAHADWFGAWEDSILDLWHANCIDRELSCSGGDLGNGTQMATTKGYDYPHGRPLADAPAKP